MKSQLIKKVLKHLHEELNILLVAANNAHLAAIDEQSIAETQYDTLAIEAGYLAEGQSKRVEELKQAITSFEHLLEMLKQTPDRHQHIKLGSIVQLSNDETVKHYLFIAPAAAGFRCSFEERNFTVITPQSPMGKALINKLLNDEVSINLGSSQFNDEVTYIA
jgi:transcription elongation GreA/GreB family factor